jgi:hypothetical protein
LCSITLLFSVYPVATLARYKGAPSPYQTFCVAFLWSAMQQKGGEKGKFEKKKSVKKGGSFAFNLVLLNYQPTHTDNVLLCNMLQAFVY